MLFSAVLLFAGGKKPIIKQTIVEEGKKYLYTVDAKEPKNSVKDKYKTLVLISWKFKGDKKGMPNKKMRKRLRAFEAKLDKAMVKKILIKSYTKTGAGVKEYGYYATDQSLVLKKFDTLFGNTKKYPITYDFYDDSNWFDLQDKYDLFE